MKEEHARVRNVTLGALVGTLVLFANHDVAAAPPLAITSPAFASGSAIPERFTCEGANVSPPVAWTEGPPGTKSFALLVEDPDAPDPKAPTRTWVQWIVYDLPAATRSIDEAAQHLPPAATQGMNDRHQPRYEGPCPAIGQHRYFFRLYALDNEIHSVLGPIAREELEQRMKGHVLARTEMIGTYAMHPVQRHARR